MQTMTNYRSESRRTSDERGRPPLAARLSPLVTLLAVGTAALFGAPGPAAWAAPVTITEQTPTPPAHAVRGSGGGTQASAALAAVRYTAKAPKLAADVQPSAAILQTAARRLSIVS